MSAEPTLTVPTLSEDPDAPTEERLTPNVIHGLVDRYAQYDENGEVMEDWDDIFHRVAKNIAVADAIHSTETVYVESDVLADWVDRVDWDDQKEVDPRERFFARSSADSIVDGGTVRHELVEELGPYVSAENLREYLPATVEQTFDAQRERYEELMRARRFMPNSPTLMNAGTELQQLSACFVDSPTDDLTDIGQTQTEAAEIFHSGGGMGYAFHNLRPNGAMVSRVGESSGPMPFMNVFNANCGAIQQGGRRRGAQMGIMHVQHPDIGRFVTAKRDEDSLSNFNISVGITGEFRTAVENDEQYVLYDPESGLLSENPRAQDALVEMLHFYDPEFEDAWNDERDKPGMGLDGKVVKENFWRDHQEKMQDPEAFDQFRDRINIEEGEPLTLPARFIWRCMIDGAHNNGEPGLFNIEYTNEEHSFDIDEHPEMAVHATNPCGEQPLMDYEACNLAHVNLSLLAKPDRPMWSEFDVDAYNSTEEAISHYVEESVEVDRLRAISQDGTRFLDNVVTMSRFPLPEIEETVRSNRKIGLGLMGFAQLCVQLGIEYGSGASYALASELMRRIDLAGTEQSTQLAAERGVFENYEQSKYADLESHPEWATTHAHQYMGEVDSELPLRNRAITTIAPTGTTSMIGDTSGGCEPIYNVAYYKNVSDDVQGDEMLVEFDDYFLETLEANDLDVDAIKQEAETLMENNEFDGPSDLSTVPDELASAFTTTAELSPEQHLRIQDAFQAFCDSGISKTCNLPNDATVDDVEDAYLLALELDVKGMTVYRDGSRENQVLTTRQDNKLDDEDAELIEEVEEALADDDDDDVREQLAQLAS
ncbi:adenosylcobalamin-dependent ribonucleoside-diphosphate reductase [Halosegnis longus]|uniref:adenosylcobalamin-dependent ribonucleoside-diphosphate reductase n=1 Tax=Halosegnis longus TaxID=2216012 RepID=UPI00129E8743|nr:adenosylcobalamin-dependent ribonucleoside-diphosphate reductase [Halosegnis longus]